MRSMAGVSVALVLGASAAVAQAPTFWAQATFVRGEVAATFPGREEAAQPVRRGDVLDRGAVVRCGPESRATLLLSDGSLLVVPATSSRTVEPPSGQGRPSLAEVAHNLTRTVVERGEGSNLLKHVGGLRDERANLAVCPRRTRVRRGPVLLIWEAAPGVDRYRARVLGEKGVVLDREVEGLFLSLEASELDAGATYVWEVRDATSPGALLAIASGSFGVLDDAAAARLAALEEEISGLEPPSSRDDSSAAYLGYLACRDAELFLEALLRLEELLEAEPDDPTLLAERESLRDFLGLDQARVTRARTALAGR